MRRRIGASLFGASWENDHDPSVVVLIPHDARVAVRAGQERGQQDVAQLGPGALVIHGDVAVDTNHEVVRSDGAVGVGRSAVILLGQLEVPGDGRRRTP